MHLSDVAGEMERAGFRILDIRSVREHYARTCREWVARLATNRDTCIPLVGERTYRTWLLFLAGSACSFETGGTGAFSVLAVKF